MRSSGEQAYLELAMEGQPMHTYSRAAGTIMRVLLATLLLSSCGSYRLVNPEAEEIERKVKVDGTVSVFTAEGYTFKLRVTAVTADAVIGTDPETLMEHKILFREIGLIEKKPKRKIPDAAIALPIIFGLMAACAANCGSF